MKQSAKAVIMSKYSKKPHHGCARPISELVKNPGHHSGLKCSVCGSLNPCRCFFKDGRYWTTTREYNGHHWFDKKFPIDKLFLQQRGFDAEVPV